MIKTYRDYKEYLKCDMARNVELRDKNMLFEFLKGNIRAYEKYRFLKNLRFMEYCENNFKNGGVFFKLLYIIQKHRFQRCQIRTQIFIHPNVFGPGLNIEHPGFQWADESTAAGENITILPRVLLGKKDGRAYKGCIRIGDNVYIGTGVTILGPVKIGSNVLIAAGSVVIKDIPDNCMVAGNPAIVKKYNYRKYPNGK